MNVFPFAWLLLLPAYPAALPAQQMQALPPTRKLTLADFKGVPDPRSDHMATTFTLLSYEYAGQSPCTETGKVKFVFSTHLRVGEKSWIRFDKIRSRQLLTDLLDHEQGHYDIAELLAAQLQQVMSRACFDRNNYPRQIDSLYQLTNRYYAGMQTQYDTETNYGQNPELQARWKVKISALHQKTGSR